MARKRMIDPNIWQSEDFSRLSTLARLVFIGLFSNADDYGRGRGKAAYIKSILFPYDEGIRVIDVDKTLSEIASNMSVTFYLRDESEYYSLDKWQKWQKVDRPRDSYIPEFDDQCIQIRRTFDESSTNVRRSLDDDSSLIEKNRIEENRIEKKEKRSAPEKIKFGEFVSMTNDEFSSLVAKLGENGVKRCIEILDNYKGSSGKKYASDYRAILNWVIKRYEDDAISLNPIRGSPPQQQKPIPGTRSYDQVKADIAAKQQRVQQALVIDVLPEGSDTG